MTIGAVDARRVNHYALGTMTNHQLVTGHLMSVRLEAMGVPHQCQKNKNI